MPRRSFSRKDRARIVLRISPLLSYELGRGVHLRAERIEEIRRETLRLVEAGHTQQEVAAALGASTSRLSRWCRSAVMETKAPLRLLKHTDRTLMQAAWDRIEVAAPDTCWPWRGFVKSNGYGSLNYKGKAFNAHRLVYSLLVATIPDGQVVDHICGNPGCVNPRHLQAVSQSENLMLSGRRRRNA